MSVCKVDIYRGEKWDGKISRSRGKALPCEDMHGL
jgi:hypothetical protein